MNNKLININIIKNIKINKNTTKIKEICIDLFIKQCKMIFFYIYKYIL